ncbi:hypothetical protein [Streptomyces chromofuscus]|uniref:Regulatory protein n=1 Tax=Streptomyces chromofuscus TaxID=42881 RepID=A0A7M2T981_STRCW|nr:hypothetical protein [Streptomyces chromofuscus]QOV44689.1 hypothetical protein IPT68_01225 [Streptomyces chromofuscus]GGT01109.1 hypothetical protein GCM10010254_21690 [Streptomyces chromofuscus]
MTTENTTQATELASQYINQVAGDLERNAKEQDRIAAEIAALQQQLTALQHDHAVLVNVQQALGIAATASEPAPADSATVPSPRKKASDAPGKKAKEAVADEPTAKRATKRSTAKKPTTKNADSKAAQPTLVELVRRHLTEQSEPRSAAEVATALSQVHPDRGIKTTVVRTTLENLVAKNQAQRTKQGSSVFYTATPEDSAGSAED